MLDIIYIALTLALFALVSLIGAGAERLGPHVRSSSAPREAMIAEEAR